MGIFEKYNLKIEGRGIIVNLPLKHQSYYPCDILRSILSQHIIPNRIQSINLPQILQVQKGRRSNCFFPSDSGFVFVQQNKSIVYDMFSNMDAAEAGGRDETGDTAIPLLELPTKDFVEILEEWIRHHEKMDSEK